MTTKINILAIDLAKGSFQVCAVGPDGACVVERTFAWLGRCRRLAKDWEASIASSDAWLLMASIRRMVRHVVRARKRQSGC